MAFIKGQSKIGGRTTGTPNTMSRTIRSRISELVESRFDNLASNLSELEPKEQIVVLLKLMEFVVPKATPARVEETPAPTAYDFGHLSLEKMLLLKSLLEEAQGDNQPGGSNSLPLG